MNLTVAKILNMKEAGELFSCPENIKAEYKQLARQWHPDISGNNEVMSKINVLFKEGLILAESGKWKKPNFVAVKGKDGRKRELSYLTSFNFELGVTYIGNTFLAYFIDKPNRSLYNNAINVIKSLKYSSENMRKECERYMPIILDTFETDEHLVLVIKKTKDLLSLRHVLEYFKGGIEDKHSAWIISRLHNIACFLYFNSLSHNCILLDSCFISPEFHTVALLGGWWYAVPFKEKMIGVPANVYSLMPPKAKEDKLGSNLTDMESIRALGREILGDRNGTKLLSMKVAPEPMINYLRSFSSQSSFSEYNSWSEVLDKSFGKRKFIELQLNADNIYNKK